MAAVVSRRLVVLVLPLAVALAGCDVSLGKLTARATDEWTHTYPLTAGGEVRIVNTNGKVDVEGVEGSTVEVRAERIARGATGPRRGNCCRESSSRKTANRTACLWKPSA